jgi:hypothetical protein
MIHQQLPLFDECFFKVDGPLGEGVSINFCLGFKKQRPLNPAELEI